MGNPFIKAHVDCLVKYDSQFYRALSVQSCLVRNDRFSFAAPSKMEQIL